MDFTQIKDIRPGQRNINVIFIVLDVSHPTVTKENREVRTFKVADMTACINVSIWDEPGQLLLPGDIVKLTKGYANVWRSCLTLYSGKNGDIQKIGEFCMIFNEALNMSDPTQNPTPPINNSSETNNITGNSSGNNNGALSRHPSVPNSSSGNMLQQNSVGSTKVSSQNVRFNNEQTGGKSPSKSNQRGKGGPRNGSRSEKR